MNARSFVVLEANGHTCHRLQPPLPTHFRTRAAFVDAEFGWCGLFGASSAADSVRSAENGRLTMKNVSAMSAHALQLFRRGASKAYYCSCPARSTPGASLHHLLVGVIAGADMTARTCSSMDKADGDEEIVDLDRLIFVRRRIVSATCL